MRSLRRLVTGAAAMLLLVGARTPAEQPVAAATPDDTFPVHIRVDAAATQGPLQPIWRFFGADEPNYACMPHGRELLAELGALRPDAVYFRAHNLLTSGDGTPALKWGSSGAYREDDAGRPRYDWTILDRIFDTYRECKVRPLVEVGFMPRDLSTHPEPYRHHWRETDPYEKIFTGWSYPPKDYARWAELVHQWARHCVERYGADEVATWYWETWNEANTRYWAGSEQDFFKLHDYTADAVRRALPNAQVGGPHTAGGGGKFLRDFLQHALHGTNYATGKQGTPLDFIAFHAKGSPRVVEGHVRMGIANQLRTINDAFAIIASFPEFRQTPIIIGESDPEGCAACQGPQLAYRNGTMYSSYTAAVFARKHDLAAKHGVNLTGALTWAFEFERQPLFAGFRTLATGGIDKPVLNVFRMFAKMGGQRISAESDAAVPLDTIVKSGVRGQPDVSALASLDGQRLCVLVWHYHDDDLPGPAADVTLSLANLPIADGQASVEHYRIDADHSNAYTTWLRMGSPPQPTDQRYAELEKAGHLAKLGPAETVDVTAGAATLHFRLPRQGVSLLVVK